MKINNYYQPKLKKHFLLFATLLFFIGGSNVSAQTFPSGFTQVKITEALIDPVAMDFAPDGRIFINEKAGKIRVVKNGVLLTEPLLEVPVETSGERGLDAIAIDPDFANNHYIYIYYTMPDPLHNRLSRFTVDGDKAVAGSEYILLDLPPLVAVFHNGGGMGFGPDGKIYIAIGENNVPKYSQDPKTYMGKLLRINPDGSAPSDNPYSGTEVASRTWGFGLRNPYSMAIHPTKGYVFINDVGADSFEEINDGTLPRRNFGWPTTEGPFNAATYPALNNPFFAYAHGTGSTETGCAITGGTFFHPANTNYPPEYHDKYFFMDYCTHWMRYIDVDTKEIKVFGTNIVSTCVAFRTGIDGNLYYLNKRDKHALYKIIYTKNTSPQIVLEPDSQSIHMGQPVTFSVTATGTQPLNYQWKKDGNIIPGATSRFFSIPATTGDDQGIYTVNVTNIYGKDSSTNALLTIAGANTRPVGTILTPEIGKKYRGGDTIYFSGNATDKEEGNLPESAFQWIVEFHHHDHVHPGQSIPKGIKSGSFSTFVEGEPSADVFFRLYMIVKDSVGSVDSQYVDIAPIKSKLKLVSQPQGLNVLLDGQPKTTSYEVEAVSGIARTIGVITPQSYNGTSYIFDHWEHGGNAEQGIVTKDNDTTYTAIYKDANAGKCLASGSITWDVWTNFTSHFDKIPVNTTPTFTTTKTIFEGPTKYGDNYASRMRGFICPPVSGNYTFYIASDNNSALYLSTDDDPAKKVKIAFVDEYTNSRQWTKYASQKSAPIMLLKDHRYYIEALHRESTQGDNLAVGWDLPDGTQERPIPGSRLSPVEKPVNYPPTVAISSPVNNSTFSNNANIAISANATSGGSPIVKVEFFAETTKIGEDLTYPYSTQWLNVPVGNYNLKAKATDNAGVIAVSEIVAIKVSDCITPKITPAGATTFCSGSVVLNAPVGADFKYQWKKDGNDISGATGSSYTASVGGDYQLKVIQSTCVTWSAPLKVRVQSGVTAAISLGGSSTICSGSSVPLYSSTCTGYTYQWRKNSTDIVGATSSVYNASVAGSYQVKVKKDGVTDYSAPVTISEKSCRIDEVTSGDSSRIKSSLLEMKVFPNPNNGHFTIEVHMPADTKELITIRLINTLGQLVYKKESIPVNDFLKENVDLDRNFSTGVYTLQIIIKNRIESTKIILAK